MNNSLMMLIFDVVADPDCLLGSGWSLFGIIIPLQNALSVLRPLPSEATAASLLSASWTFLPLIQAARSQL